MPNPIIKLSSPETREFWEIPVVFEDDRLLAIEKPSRLLVSPDRYDPNRPNLMKLLHRDIDRGAGWAKVRGLTYLSNAHRLDFETSGILLLAKDKPALVALADEFGTTKPKKRYVALVHGVPMDDSFDIDFPLAHHPTKPEIMRVDSKNGKKSFTGVQVIERFDGFSLFSCQPLTGRTHQIRVHLRHVGYPIVGDTLYGGSPLLLSRIKKGYRLKPGREERPLIERVALHAAGLQILHPDGQREISIQSELPKDFRVALKYLRQCAPGRSSLGFAQQEYEPAPDEQGDDQQENP